MKILKENRIFQYGCIEAKKATCNRQELIKKWTETGAEIEKSRKALAEIKDRKSETALDIHLDLRNFRERQNRYVNQLAFAVPRNQFVMKHKPSRVKITDYTWKGVTKKVLLACVQNHRRQRKAMNQPKLQRVKGLDSIFSERIGLVHDKVGFFLNCMFEKKILPLTLPKKPVNGHHYVGIEFEFTSEVLRPVLAAKLLSSGLVGCCELKKDGSLRPQGKEVGYEIAILLKEAGYKKYLRKLCRIFHEINAKTDDRRCGLHVHVDVRRREKDVVFNNLVACQHLMFQMVPKARRNGEFSMKVHSRKFPTKFTGKRQDRYMSINAAAFYRHQTLEIRMLEGTTDFATVSNWVDLLVKITNHKEPVKSSVRTMTGLRKTFAVSDAISDFMQDRMNRWAILAGTYATGDEAPRTAPLRPTAPPRNTRPMNMGVGEAVHNHHNGTVNARPEATDGAVFREGVNNTGLPDREVVQIFAPRAAPPMTAAQIREELWNRVDQQVIHDEGPEPDGEE